MRESYTSLVNIINMVSSASLLIFQMVCTFLTIGIVIFISDPHPGARHDFTVFQESVAKHRVFILKKPNDLAIVDPEQGQDRWALLADKGYVGAEAYVRAIIPKKAYAGHPLNAMEIAENRSISSARIICENFYGRLKGLFKICMDCYRRNFIINT